jgi:3-deoxy-D-manno-octulosonic-acid transferase
LSLLDLAYLCGLALFSPYLLYKAVTRPRHLAGLRARLGQRDGEFLRTGAGPCIWVHGVSVGEVAAAEPLVKALESALPDHEIVVTTSTQTGQAVARRKFPEKRVGYFPVDFSWTVKRTFEAVRPSLIVLVELELWPNFLSEAKAQKVPVVVVNGRISEKSFRGYRLGRRFLPLNDVAHYCVQTEQYAARFRNLGVPEEKITVTGSMKYDNVVIANGDAAAARGSMGLGAKDVVWIAGSTHSPEERTLVDVFARLKKTTPELRLVLAPRHNERAAEVKKTVEAAGMKPVLRSEQVRDAASGGAPDLGVNDGVLIVDTLGELSRLYAGADFVFVGGSLIPHGGQNMLEPAALGKPVLFGPHVTNFQESAERLLQAQGAIQVRDERELEQRLRELLADPEGARALGARGLKAIEEAKGATEKTVSVLRPLLAQNTRIQPESGGTRGEQRENPVPFSPRFI